MKAWILLASVITIFGLTGCKGASCDGIFTCLQRQRTVECGGNPHDGVVCRTREVCVRYGCLKRGELPPSSGFKATVGELPIRTLSKITVPEAMSLIANGDMLAAQNFGFEIGDLFRLYDGRALSSDRINEIAKSQAADPGEVAGKIDEISQAFQSQRANSASDYWQTCIQSGQWSTDRNSRCEQTYWPGCSPEQGATFCTSNLGTSRLGL